MRILALVTDAFGGTGGIAQFNRDLLRAICSHPDCNEVLAFPRLVSGELGPLPERLTYVTDASNNKVKYFPALFKKIGTSSSFDFILCGHIHLLPIAYILHYLIKAPVLLVLYGIDSWKPVKRRFASFFLKRINSFISISEFTKEQFLKWSLLKKTGFILYPCVERDHYGVDGKNQGLVNKYGLANKTVLMTLGRLDSREKYKGFGEVLELLPNLAKDMPNIVYLIAGDGTDRKWLEDKAKALGLKNRVVFTGFVPESQKADYYRLADCFVMPGRGEGFGIVYLEAMACGVPVVASKADGSREAVWNGELGVLVDPSSPEDIQRGILEALKRPKGVIPKGLDYFSYENYEKRVHAIIDQVVPKMEAVT